MIRLTWLEGASEDVVTGSKLHLKYSYLRYICFANTLPLSGRQMRHDRLKLLPDFCCPAPADRHPARPAACAPRASSGAWRRPKWARGWA